MVSGKTKKIEWAYGIAEWVSIAERNIFFFDDDENGKEQYTMGEFPKHKSYIKRVNLKDKEFIFQF